jgi:hypothetical protein
VYNMRCHPRSGQLEKERRTDEEKNDYLSVSETSAGNVSWKTRAGLSRMKTGTPSENRCAYLSRPRLRSLLKRGRSVVTGGLLKREAAFRQRAERKKEYQSVCGTSAGNAAWKRRAPKGATMRELRLRSDARIWNSRSIFSPK